MKTTHGVSIEITDRLSEKAAKIFAAWVGGFTVIKNQKTLEYQAAMTEWLAAGKQESHRPIATQEVSHFQAKLPFLKELPCQIRRNAGSQWFAAQQAHLKGLRGAPTVRPKHKKRNVYVTNELFVIQPLDDQRCVVQFKVDAKKTSKGEFFFGAVLPFPKEKAANSLYISRKGTRFWLSMSHELELNVEPEAAIRQRLVAMTDDEILAVTKGFDVGVVNQVMTSDATRLHFTGQEEKVIARKEALRAKYQKRYARAQRANDRDAKRQGPCKLRKNGTVDRPLTKREKKWLEKAARQSSDIAGIKFNRSHHTSKAIADVTPLVAVLEDIKHCHLRRKAKAKRCPETGKWLRNGATAKRALNRALASMNHGQIRSMCQYKLKDRGKLLLQVPAAYSSQTCHLCQHVSSENRETQARFVCKNCGATLSADVNAACVIKQRAINAIRHPAFLGGKTIRKLSVRKRKSNTVQELASSGNGETVIPAVRVSLGDVPNHQGDGSNPVTEMPRFYAAHETMRSMNRG